LLLDAGSALTLSNLQRRQSGMYECLARNSLGMTHASAHLAVVDTVPTGGDPTRPPHALTPFECESGRYLLLLSLLFDPGIRFLGMKKLCCAIKKVQKSSWNEPYSYSCFTKLSCSMMALLLLLLLFLF